MVFTSLLLFSILYTLKLDGVIAWSWWSVFAPLWIWKGKIFNDEEKNLMDDIFAGLAITGAGVGSWVWWRRPQARLNTEVIGPDVLSEAWY